MKPSDYHSPQSKARREAAREHVAAIRAVTLCESCNGQPIEWHHENHPSHPGHRVATMAAQGRPLTLIDAEIARCEALCHSCHMRVDGRSAALVESVRRRHRRDAVFTASDVTKIRSLYAEGGVSQRALAAQFDTGQMVISRIVNRITWRDV